MSGNRPDWPGRVHFPFDADARTDRIPQKAAAEAGTARADLWPGMIYSVQLAERRVRCDSPHCIAALVRLGWRLSDPEQLAELIQQLMTAPPEQSHEPSHHLQTPQLQ